MQTCKELIFEIAELLRENVVKRGHARYISQDGEKLFYHQWWQRWTTLFRVRNALKDWRRIRRVKGKKSVGDMIHEMSRKYDLPQGWSGKECISAIYDILIKEENEQCETKVKN